MKNKITTNSLRKIILLVAPLAFFGCYPSWALPAQPASQNQKVQEETIKELQKLTQYEIDESFLISQCIDNVKEQTLKARLLTIKNECENNIVELAILVKQYGGEPPEYSKDFKGYFMNGYAAMRGAFTDQGVLKALHTNLKLILKPLESAINSELPTEAKEALKKIYENKKRIIKDIETQF